MDRLGNYQLLRSLGQGAMGEVFLARHDYLDVLRAIKIPREELASSAGFERRFLEEGRLLNRLDHPNIVRVYDMGKDGNTLYLAMDFVSPDGEQSHPLDRVLEERGGALPWAEATRLVAQVCRAMAYAHGKGIIHRDLKPSNVLLDRHETAKVSDFGLATMAGSAYMLQSIARSFGGSMGAEGTHIAGVNKKGIGGGREQDSLGVGGTRPSGGSSRTDNLVGTFHFMPPEVQNGGEWTPQGDIYSLGVLAYRLLVGKYPVGRYKLPADANSEIPILWDTIIERAMAETVSERFESMEELLEALVVIAPELGMDRPVSSTVKAGDGEMPETAVRMVRTYVNENSGVWKHNKGWMEFLISFYRTAGHDPVTQEQLELLVKDECMRWKEQEARRLELEARQAEERRRKAEEAETRRRAAEEARKKLEREQEEARKKAAREQKTAELAASARKAAEEGHYGEENKLWTQVLELTPGDKNAQESLATATSNEAEVLGKNGQEAYDEHDYAKAVQYWGEVLNLAPGNAVLINKRDDAQKVLKKIDKCIYEADWHLFQAKNTKVFSPVFLKEIRIVENNLAAVLEMQHENQEALLIMGKLQQVKSKAKILFLSFIIVVGMLVVLTCMGGWYCHSNEFALPPSKDILTQESVYAERVAVPPAATVMSAPQKEPPDNAEAVSMNVSVKPDKTGMDREQLPVSSMEKVQKKAFAVPVGIEAGATRTFANMEFVWIPPGEFMMGGDQRPEDVVQLGGGEVAMYKCEHPQRRVTLSCGFWLGKYEVTQAQWEEVMGKNPSHFMGDGRLPVEQVSWYDCQKFIAILNSMVMGGGFRLPTEAEWEYACRAGTTTPFYFGEILSTDHANYDCNSSYGNGPKGVYRKKTMSVGSFPANAWGLHDMHGNVWEWCEDYWHYCYADAPVSSSAWDSPQGFYRVIRGGSWLSHPRFCRSAYRCRFTPRFLYYDLGLRLALSAVQDGS